MFERLVGDAFERNAFAGTQGNIRGDEQAAGRVVDAPGQRFGAETAEHDRMNDAQPRAGEHRDGQFGNHRQINGNAVAFFEAERFQHVGEFADFLVQLRVSERADVVLRFALPDEGGFVARLGFQMAVETIHRHVELAVLEPGVFD